MIDVKLLQLDLLRWAKSDTKILQLHYHSAVIPHHHVVQYLEVLVDSKLNGINIVNTKLQDCLTFFVTVYTMLIILQHRV